MSDSATYSGEVEQSNAEVRERQYCQYCSVSVREHDYEHKYAQAGGVLAGPFCSHHCQFMWLIDPSNDHSDLRGGCDV
jgi:hypothetical protein